MSREKIGYFGGTFDPPHIGHLILASEAAYQFKLSRLYWALTPQPPHKQKQAITPLEHRLAMLKSMIANNSIFEFSRLEIDRPGPHYAIDTVRLLAQHEPSADIILLIGGDSLRDLPTWRLSPDLLTAVSKIGVMRRPEDSLNLPALEEKLPGLTEKLTFIHALLQPVSSRELRRRIAAGEMYRYYVPPSVYDYIEENKLYRGK
ncbi:MAG: nicotinate (nicotinamide) nucleotide adenylyltransferase [Chloroflexi bacterium]|nr:nicotinate (nicotinamide) nucleotide adenylyltransferase [Chloroflexota bacterium]